MNRTSFLVASASAVAASSGIATAESVPGGTHFVETKADFNEAAFRQIVGRGQIRQVFEQIAFKPQALQNVKNSLNGLTFGFGYSPSDVTIAFAPHGPSAALNYSDYLWDKYKLGDFFAVKDPQTGATIASNQWVKAKSTGDTKDGPDDPKGMYQDTSIEMLQKRGVVFLCCHTAVEEQARNLVKPGAPAAGANATEVANDILTHLIPGAVVVPSMVATVAVLQHQYNYAYTALTF